MRQAGYLVFRFGGKPDMAHCSGRPMCPRPTAEAIRDLLG